MELTKKHKHYSYTHYYRGVELNIMCVTTSKKKFADLLGVSTYDINRGAYSGDPKILICNENPDVLFAEPGMGGEAFYIFKKGEVKPFEEYKALINEHRKVYPSYRDFYEKNISK